MSKFLSLNIATFALEGLTLAVPVAATKLFSKRFTLKVNRPSSDARKVTTGICSTAKGRNYLIMPERELTEKEKKAIAEFDRVRPGAGAIAESNIRNNQATGWADIIAATPEEELTAREGSSSNSFMYKRIG